MEGFVIVVSSLALIVSINCYLRVNKVYELKSMVDELKRKRLGGIKA